MNNLTKKKNTEAKVQESSELQLKTKELEDKGVKNLVFIGLTDKGMMMLDSSLGSYEEIHAALNRATLEVTMAHIKHVMNENKGEQDEA